MIEKIVALLNEAAALDPAAMRLLVEQRQSCNDKLANHPRIAVGNARDVRGIGQGGSGGGFRASIGMIGLLNALEPDKQRIVAVIDDDVTKPICFEVGTPKTHPKLFNANP